MIKYEVTNYFKEPIVLYNGTNYAKIYQRHSPSPLLPEKQQASLQPIWGTDNDKSHFNSCTKLQYSITPYCQIKINLTPDKSNAFFSSLPCSKDFSSYPPTKNSEIAEKKIQDICLELKSTQQKYAVILGKVRQCQALRQKLFSFQ